MDTTTRVIYSTWDKAADLDPDRADVLRETIDRAGRNPLRESTTADKHGQSAARAFVAEYTDPADDTVRFAHFYDDQTGNEYKDFPTREQAEADYEDNVRALQDSVAGTYDGDGEENTWFTQTDVR